MFGKTIKSLVKSGMRDLKGKFSKDDGDDEFPTPFGLRIGAAVDIDTLPLRMHADELHVVLPDATMMIVAQGYIDLGDGTYVHRYYNRDDAMIQVLTVGGMEDQHVEEVTLFVPYKSYYPDGAGNGASNGNGGGSNSGSWAQWLGNGGRLGASKFRLDDGTEYARIWFDTADGHVKPVVFTESVYEDPESDDCSDVVHNVMLYGRNLQQGKKNEYLLVSVEAYGGERTVELMVGVDLETANLNVI